MLIPGHPLGEWEENRDILTQSLAAIQGAVEVRQRKVNEARGQ